MLYRPQHGSLIESLFDCVDIPNTKEALALHLKVKPSDIDVKFYTYDDRINWDTYLVCVKGQAVGYTSGPLLKGDNNAGTQDKL
jgi:hypothetical protein